jgi:hypothetical protein
MREESKEEVGFLMRKESRVVMSTIPKRKYKRSDIAANYRNETKTF